MIRQTTLRAALAVLALTFPAAAHEDGGMQVKEAYATATPQSGAVFMRVENHTPGDDRLIAVASDVAKKVEMHTSKAGDDGVMKMLPIEGGVAVAKGKSHDFARGGDHVMLMGLNRKLQPGDTLPLTLTFETFGPVTVEVTVVKPGEGAPAADHSGHGMAPAGATDAAKPAGHDGHATN